MICPICPMYSIQVDWMYAQKGHMGAVEVKGLYGENAWSRMLIGDQEKLRVDIHKWER